MTGILKKFFKGRHTVKDSFLEREADDRRARRSNSRAARFDQQSEPSPAAAYHTETQPRSHRGAQSFAGANLSDEGDRYEYFNRSLELNRVREEVYMVIQSTVRLYFLQELSRRRRSFKSCHRKRGISEYQNENHRPTSSLHEPTLDDTESDSWAIEREKRNYELERKLQEERVIIKEYRERFKMERDLRVTKEMELREYRERYKMERELCADKDRELLAVKDELRRVKKQKKKLVNIVNIMQAKLNFSEQSGAYEAMFPAPKSDDVAGAGESLCADKATNVPGSSTFSTSTLHNTSDFADETKNFRRVTSFDTEVPRDFDPTGFTTDPEEQERITLRNDNFHDFSMNSGAEDSRRVHSDSNLQKFIWSFSI
ncbi:unnamed protein product [Enterobius vermicularis]|uniref:Uncharacterized protein n=1 Tax=Enterobius vermicularis TaxID=51028 RepID=A0A0N4VL40_ENTVE|nr:unnamed protein product [Enterobius vermicularis]